METLAPALVNLPHLPKSRCSRGLKLSFSRCFETCNSGRGTKPLTRETSTLISASTAGIVGGAFRRMSVSRAPLFLRVSFPSRLNLSARLFPLVESDRHDTEFDPEYTCPILLISGTNRRPRRPFSSVPTVRLWGPV